MSELCETVDCENEATQQIQDLVVGDVNKANEITWSAKGPMKHLCAEHGIPDYAHKKVSVYREVE